MEASLQKPPHQEKEELVRINASALMRVCQIDPGTALSATLCDGPSEIAQASEGENRIV